MSLRSPQLSLPFFNKRWVLASTHYRQSPGHNPSCLFYSCIALLCKASLLRRTLNDFGTHLDGGFVSFGWHAEAQYVRARLVGWVGGLPIF
jgi:hypothetical protein